jgi:hypothetical protein
MFGVVFGQILFMSAVGTVLSHALTRSALGNDPSAPPRVGGKQQLPLVGVEGNANMSDYEYDDDDDVGAIGADYLIGDDDDDDDDDDDVDDLVDDLVSGEEEIVGRRRRRRRKGVRRGKRVIRRRYSRDRRYPLGFTPTDIATTVTSSIAAAPQNLYRPERLIIPSEIAPDIGVVDVKVGTQSQFAQNTEVPASVFSEVAIDAYVHFDSAKVGNQVYIQARNKSAGTVNFTAALIGTVAK